MNKLSKEQAGWLIEKLDKDDGVIPTHDMDATIAGVSYERARLRKLINECVECQHEIMDVLLSMPPKYKCNKCGEYIE